MSGPGPVGSQAKRIAAADLRTLLEGKAPGLRVLDTRGREAYEAGHLPGSLHCFVHDLAHREKDLPPRASTVVLVGEPGRRTDGAAVFLLLAGYASVLVLEGGFAAWTGAVERGPGPALDSWRPPRPKGWTDPPAPA